MALSFCKECGDDGTGTDTGGGAEDDGTGTATGTDDDEWDGCANACMIHGKPLCVMAGVRPLDHTLNHTLNHTRMACVLSVHSPHSHRTRAQGGMGGLILRLKQDGHGQLRVYGPPGVGEAMKGLSNFVRWQHPEVHMTELHQLAPKVGTCGAATLVRAHSSTVRRVWPNSQ